MAARRRGLCAAIPILLIAAPGASATYEALTSVIAGTELRVMPVTVNLAPRPAFGSAFHNRTKAPIILMLEEVEGETKQPIRINIFLDKTDADQKTSTEDPSFVGVIQLLPVRDRIHTVSYAFDLSQTLRLEQIGPIHVTFVPVIGRDDIPGYVLLQVARIYIGREREE